MPRIRDSFPERRRGKTIAVVVDDNVIRNGRHLRAMAASLFMTGQTVRAIDRVHSIYSKQYSDGIGMVEYDNG